MRAALVERVRLRRAGHLRGRRLVQARLPAGDRHRRAGQGRCAPARTRARAERTALRAARRYAAVERAARAGLRTGGLAARVLGDGAVAAVTGAAAPHRLRRAGPALVARRAARRPGAPAARPSARAPPPSTCRRASTGSSACPAAPRTGGSRCPRRWSRSRRAPGCRCGSRADVAGHCCAVPWSSKGYREGHAEMAARTTADACGAGPSGGELPVVIDASSCAHGLARGAAPEGVEVLDAVAWAHDRLLPPLEVRRPAGRGHGPPALLHPPPGTGRDARVRRRARWPTRSSCL